MTALTDPPLAEGAVQAVLEAGKLLADPAAVRSIRAKSETDYVTNVDLAVQKFLRERLAALAPDVQFMGEEQDNSALDLTRPCWILDPVDGTTNLIHQFQHSAISLALAEGGQIVFGVPAGGSWRTRRFARCGRCMTGARTSGGRAVPAWNCAMWPADGWRAMWSCLSSPGTTPLECSSWRRPGDRLPLLAAPPFLWRRVGLCWPPMGGSTARCKQF